MPFEIKQHKDILIINIQQLRLDAMHARDLKEEINRAVANHFCKIVLDFEQVSFLDSSGLGVLVNAQKIFKSPGGVVLCGIHNRTIQDLLRLTRMDRVFKIVDSVEFAIQQFD